LFARLPGAKNAAWRRRTGPRTRAVLEGCSLAPTNRNDLRWKRSLLGRLLNHSVGSIGGHAASCDPADYDLGDWAWEFLRRNQHYVADWRSSVPRHLPSITLKDGTQLLRLRRRFPRAEKWGLYAFADPALCAHRAHLFWHANALKRMVRLNAKKPHERDQIPPRTRADFKADRKAIIGVDCVPRV
jgi:Family of unknown function (DUF6499)